MTHEQLKQILIEVEPEELITTIIEVFGQVDAAELAYRIIEETK